MKKNITINLYGSLYAIDEDAYELLKRYEDNLRAYFSRQADGQEIADDIERRVADLFEELKAQGVEAITIEHVQDIITRLGKPEEMAGEAEDGAREAFSAGAKAQSGPQVKKKLFRDPNDKMLGGVVSGFSHYFGGDVLLWRLLVVALCFLSFGTTLIVYLILWLLMPEARTAEEQLLMNGRRVTPENLAQTVVDESMTADAQPAVERGGVSRLLSILMGIFKVILFVIGAFFIGGFALTLLTALIVACVGVAGLIVGGHSLYNFGVCDANFIPYVAAGTSWAFWGLLAAVLVVCVIPIYCFVHHLLRLVRKVQPMSVAQRAVWIVVWFLAVAGIVVSGAVLARNLDKADQLYREQHVEQIDNTADDAALLPDTCVLDADSLASVLEGKTEALEEALKEEKLKKAVSEGVKRIVDVALDMAD